MKRYFTEEENKELIEKGLSQNQINEINETIHLYYKKYSQLDIGKIEKKILGLKDVKQLADSAEGAFGVKQDKLLGRVVLDFIEDNYIGKSIYTEIFYRTIRSAAPDYMDMGGTSYYKVFLNQNHLTLYCLDNFFRLVEIKNISMEEIEGIKLYDEIKIEGRMINIYYLRLKVKSNDGNGMYYMYSTKKMKDSTLTKLFDLLIEKGVKEVQLKNQEESKASTKLGIWISIIFIVIIVIGIIAGM